MNQSHFFGVKFFLAGIARRHREVGRVSVMLHDLRIDQLPVGASVAVVGVAKLRGHVRHVQVLVHHQRRISGRIRQRLRPDRAVNDLAVRVFDDLNAAAAGQRHPGGVLLNLGHRVHLAVIKRLKMPARGTRNRPTPGCDVPVRASVHSSRERVVRHRRRVARHPTVRSVLPVVGRQRVEVLHLGDERVVNRRPLTRRRTQ